MINVFLLGSPRVISNGADIIFPYRKAEGLFYYLCVRKSVSRDEVIGIFWADNAESTARKNLRDAIYNLKKLFGEHLILAEGNNRLSLNPEIISSIDYDMLNDENYFRKYTENFLGYFYVKNCMEFESWVDEIRAEMLQRYEQAAEREIKRRMHAEDAGGLLECGSELLKRKQLLNEALFQKIFQLLIDLEAYHEVELLYERLKRVLADELEVPPDDKTEQLMQKAAILKADQPIHGETQPDNYFLGRTSELSIIQRSIRNYAAGRDARSILITGEAGIGKSAMLRRLSSLLKRDAFIIVSYQCVQAERDLYLKPWNDILTQIKNLCRTFHLPEGVKPDIYSEQASSALFSTQYELYAESLLETLQQGLKDRRLIICIDDIQWMDDASRRVLSNLISWSANRKALVIMASRPDEKKLTALKSPLISAGLVKELPLRCFTREEIETFVREQNPALLKQKDFLNLLCRRTDGNALFLTEYLREMQHGGNFQHLPEKITGMLQSRLMNLREQERELLDYISLNPRFMTIDELQVFCPLGKLELLKSLEVLLQRQLLEVKGLNNLRGYGFTHQLIQDYIYHLLLDDKKTALHALMAENCEQKFLMIADVSVCPMLIYHFSCCGDSLKALTYRLEYMRAMYAVQHEIYPTVFDRSTEIEEYTIPLGSADELFKLAQQIRALPQKGAQVDTLRMKMEFLIGRYDLFAGYYSYGLRNIRTSISLAEKLHNAQYLMENHLQLIFHGIQVHNLNIFLENLEACESLLNQYDYAEAALCTVMRLRAVYYMKTGQYPAAEAALRQLTERFGALCRLNASYRVALAACHNYMGELKQLQGQPEAALTLFREAIRCCGEEKNISGIAVFYCNAGNLLYQKGLYSEARSYIDRANECLDQLGAMWSSSRAKSLAALLDIEEKQPASALKHYHAAQRLAAQSKNPEATLLVQQVEKKLRKTGLL